MPPTPSHFRQPSPPPHAAAAQGLYTKAGLDVSFISPHSDQYKATPASRVESGEAMFAIAPSGTPAACLSVCLSMPRSVSLSTAENTCLLCLRRECCELQYVARGR
jgi:hypothetical protein